MECRICRLYSADERSENVPFIVFAQTTIKSGKLRNTPNDLPATTTPSSWQRLKKPYEERMQQGPVSSSGLVGS